MQRTDRPLLSALWWGAQGSSPRYKTRLGCLRRLMMAASFCRLASMVASAGASVVRAPRSSRVLIATGASCHRARYTTPAAAGSGRQRPLVQTSCPGIDSGRQVCGELAPNRLCDELAACCTQAPEQCPPVPQVPCAPAPASLTVCSLPNLHHPGAAQLPVGYGPQRSKRWQQRHQRPMAVRCVRVAWGISSGGNTGSRSRTSQDTRQQRSLQPFASIPGVGRQHPYLYSCLCLPPAPLHHGYQRSGECHRHRHPHRSNNCGHWHSATAPLFLLLLLLLLLHGCVVGRNHRDELDKARALRWQFCRWRGGWWRRPQGWRWWWVQRVAHRVNGASIWCCCGAAGIWCWVEGRSGWCGAGVGGAACLPSRRRWRRAAAGRPTRG